MTKLKKIKLRTTKGEIIYSNRYSIYEDHILTENNNLVHIENLARIKGRVMEDAGRVAAGALLLAAGVILVGPTLAIATLALTPGQFLLFSVIEAGMIVGGARIMGRRTFLMDKGWEVQTLPPRE